MLYYRPMITELGVQREQFADKPDIVASATRDALSRLPEGNGHEARARILRGIENRFKPTVLESEEIADQLKTPEYLHYKEEIAEFLDWARIGIIVCPDGRINPYLAISDPGVMVFHQRLAGKPEVRPSSGTQGGMTLNDPNITGGLVTAVRKRREINPEVEMIEFIGPHIYSEEPEHGCGALKLQVSKNERSTTSMRFGGIERYYDELGAGFDAFNNAATNNRELGVPSTTFDISHDIHSQGLIFGIRSTYPEFNPNKSLRENLVEQHREGKIVMTEFLDDTFKARIHDVAESMFGPDHEIANPLDSTRLAQNIMKIGRIAKAITLEEEARGFDFIPEDLIKDATPTAKRVLAYTLIRNVVYRRLADIRAGHHPLLKHNEETIRVGSGGPRNIDHVSFVIGAPNGQLRESDIDDVFALEDNILRGTLKSEKNVDPEKEAAIIVVGTTFDPSKYIDEETAQAERDIAFSTVGNNAARIRNMRPNDIRNGYRVVIGAFFGPDRTITEIVR